ncbi:MAG: tyrosine--tRNA ligase [Spirochaetes bacterium GWF1_51_8]|nr:MAG: tyrosine--tRNA ligase [Spirochaetes bacterium GWF1_51_8]
MKHSVDEQMKIISRGAVEIIPEEELRKKLEKSLKEDRPLRIKFGADPSAPDIHLGHTVPLRKLRQFQELGHEVYFLIGDFTAMIGDPTGKSETRKRLTREEVLRNAESYKQQIFKILDPRKTKIVFNSDWCSKMMFSDVLELTSFYSVARMLERDDFAKRYKENRSISIIEFMYPLIQGYDSVALKADVEIGGTDQKFNLLVGRDLQTAYGQDTQAILTMPIIEGTDGVQKMSKSLGNYIGVSETPKEIFGKVMSIPDNLIAKYFELLTDVPLETVKDYEKKMKAGENPRDFKVKLGQAIVEQLYTKKDAEEVLIEFERIFKEKGLPDVMPEFIIDKPMSIVDIVAAAGVISSKSEMRRMISQNAVSIDGEKIKEEVVLSGGKEQVIKVGKRIFLKVK